MIEATDGRRDQITKRVVVATAAVIPVVVTGTKDLSLHHAMAIGAFLLPLVGFISVHAWFRLTLR
jgi:hypothetical protein